MYILSMTNDCLPTAENLCTQGLRGHSTKNISSFLASRSVFRMSRILLCIGCIIWGVSGETVLTEYGAVQWGIRHSNDMATLRLNEKSDALDSALIHSQWLPRLSAHAEFSPQNRTWVDSGNGDSAPSYDTSYATLSADLGVTQVVPGGGALDLNLQTGQSNLFDKIQSENSMAVVYSQPLLRDAWRWGDQNYAQRLEGYDRVIFHREYEKKLVSEISRMRTGYWSWFQHAHALRIRRIAVEKAQLNLERERVRLRTGTAARIDTLKVYLELLKLQQSVFEQELTLRVRKHDLMTRVSLPADSAIAVPDMEIEIMPTPSKEDLRRLVHQFDPSLNLLKSMQEKLAFLDEYYKNRFLPEASVSYEFEIGQTSTEETVRRNSVISFLLSYEIPAKSRKISLKKNQLDQEKIALERSAYERDLDFAIDTLIDNWEYEMRNLSMSKSALAVARQYVEAAEAGYQAGTISQLQLLDAQTELIAQEYNYLQREIALKYLEIIYEEVTGIVLNKFGVQLK